jgi:hypothetical protein
VLRGLDSVLSTWTILYASCLLLLCSILCLKQDGNAVKAVEGVEWVSDDAARATLRVLLYIQVCYTLCGV